MRRSQIFLSMLLVGTLGSAATACGGDDEPLFGDSGSGAGNSTGSGAGGSGGTDAKFTPAPGGARRILGRHYVGSIRLLLGDAAAAAAKPPTDYSLFEWDAIGGSELSITGATGEEYETSAMAIADAVVADPSKLAETVPCVSVGPKDASCYKALATDFGRLAWRRPLAAEEITRLEVIAAAAESWAKAEVTQPDPFGSALKYTLSAILQSPNFLYQPELGVEDPNKPGHFDLTGYEIATRLSFFFLGRTPDAALLAQAESGALDTADGVRAAAWAMLSHPDSVTSVTDFFREMLYLDDLDTLAKDPAIFPVFSPTVAAAMKESSMRFVQDVVLSGTDMHELYTADYQYVNPDLAPVYGVPAPASGGWEKVPMPPEQMRSGLLGSAAFLARFAHPSRTSPTRRGAFVNVKLVCFDIEPPPAGVNTTIPEDPPGMPTTMKDKLTQHQEDPSCSSCHKQIDPIGLSLEHFDGMGMYRDTDNGLVLDTAGEVETFGAFANPLELGAILRDDPRTSYCMIKNFIRGGLGHLETPGESDMIDLIEASFSESGYRIQNVMVEIAASPLFRVVGEAK